MDAQALVAWNLRKLRVAKGLSQEALADAAAIDRTYVSRLERRMENPTVGVLEKVAASLGIAIGQFFVPPAPDEEIPLTLKSGRPPKPGNGGGGRSK